MEYLGKHATKATGYSGRHAKARVLSQDEVMLLPLNQPCWLEFRISKGRINLCNPFFLKGHRAKNRMQDYGATWRAWSKKPTYEERTGEGWNEGV